MQRIRISRFSNFCGKLGEFFVLDVYDLNIEIMTEKEKFRLFYYSLKDAYPWRLYSIKITRIQEVENLAFGHL